MKTKKSISFIENPEELSLNDMHRIKGGVNQHELAEGCHSSGTQNNCTTSGTLNTIGRPISNQEALGVC